MTIVLPLPSPDLNPNARVYWRRLAEAKKVARQEACLAATSRMNELGWCNPPRWKAATAQCRFFWRTNHRHDRDNAAASCKAIWDGFTDAGVWADDAGVIFLPVLMAVSAINPRLEIDVAAVEKASVT